MAQVHTLDSPSVQVQKKGQKVGCCCRKNMDGLNPFSTCMPYIFFPQDFPFYWKGTCVFNHHRKNAKQEVLSTMRAGCHGLHVLWQLCHLLFSCKALYSKTKSKPFISYNCWRERYRYNSLYIIPIAKHLVANGVQMLTCGKARQQMGRCSFSQAEPCPRLGDSKNIHIC